jgi:exopolyphosphatase/guanosine-5'-triphosphate,3'-diphosphate pyrophosphatase
MNRSKRNDGGLVPEGRDARGCSSDGAQGRTSGHSEEAPALAALDLGTNNCRLLIARPDGDNFVVVDAFSRAVRLGEGVEHSNHLGEEAQLRAIKALRICAAKIRQHQVSDARIVATEACRRASNGPGFIRRVSREIGLPMEIISAEEEARLAVAGCAPLIDPECEQLLVFDIGGGSTELIWIDMSRTPASRRVNLIRALAPGGPRQTESDHARAAAAHIADWISVPMGVSTLHDRFSEMDDEAQQFEAMSRHFEQHLARFAPSGPAMRNSVTPRLQIIGVSGTATTFGALHLGLKNYDRAAVDGLWLPTASAAAIAAKLLEMGPDRVEHPGIGANRAKLILSGTAILTTILRLWPVDRIRVADRGLREGMLYGMLHQRRIAAQ